MRERWRAEAYEENQMKEIKRQTYLTNLGPGMKNHISATSTALLENSQLASALRHPCFKVFFRTEKLKLVILTLWNGHFGLWPLCQPCSGGPSVLAPVYMMEHVKPQHSFSRVRPVLAKGDDAC